MVLDHKQKKDFVDDIEDYLHPDTCNWYQSRGLPYRRGYLLYGPPGTGKSSLCLAIASRVRLDIYMLSLNANKLDKNSLALLFYALPKRCVIVFKDVDHAGIRKRSTDGPFPLVSSREVTDHDKEMDGYEDSEKANQPLNGISLSTLLNVIDGVAAQEGRILIMTTNHIEKLDPALLRPGRVDMRIALDYADQRAIQELFLAFHMTPADNLSMGIPDATGAIRPISAPISPNWTVDNITALSVEFAKHIPSGKLTAADIQSYLLKYKKAPESAVAGVMEWVESKHITSMEAKVGQEIHVHS